MATDTPTEKTTVRSRELGTDYLLLTRRAPIDQPAGAVFVLDADDQFAMATDAVQKLEQQGKVPGWHVIGAAYGGSYRSPLNRRMRDYTPTRDPQEPAETGGAPRFLEFLVERLLPQAAERLPLDRTQFILAGHSLGSLFGLFALTQSHSPFSRYLISSPSIWWDNRAVLEPLREAAARPPPPRSAFFSVGDLDSESMRGDLALLGSQLGRAPIPGLDFVVQDVPGRDHFNAFPVAAVAGLEWLARRGRAPDLGAPR